MGVTTLDVSDPVALAHYARRCADLETKLADLREVEAQRMKLNEDLGRKCDELHKELRALKEPAGARQVTPVDSAIRREDCVHQGMPWHGPAEQRPAAGIIYLSSPYTHAHPSVMTRRYELALAKLAELTRAGLIVFSPIVHSHHLTGPYQMPQDWAFWERVDRAFLSACSALYVLNIEGWKESTGVQAEIKIAVELGLSVHLVDAVPTAEEVAAAA